LILPPTLRTTLFPYTTLFRSPHCQGHDRSAWQGHGNCVPEAKEEISRAVRIEQRWKKSSLRRVTIWPPRFERPNPNHGHFASWRSEEHTSELQSRSDLVCRLL